MQFRLALVVALAVASGWVRPAVSEDRVRIRWFPPRLSVGESHILGKARYSNESKLGLGAELLRRFRHPGAATGPPSEIRVGGLITTRLTGRARLRTNLFFGSGQHLIRSRLEFDNIRSRFWGLGADTPASDEEIFQAQSILAYTEFLSRRGSFEFGVRAEMEEVAFLEVESGGLFETESYRGLEQDTAVGMGLVLNRDTRDRRESPTRGTLTQSLFMAFPTELGGELSFNLHSVDVRAYWSAGRGWVIAGQVFTYAVRGNPPVWRFAELGGRAHSRGYRRARYRDRFLASSQLELRTPAWGRVSMVGFAGVAGVAPTLGRLQSSTLRPTVGAGTRVAFGRDDDVVVRVDLAFGVDSIRFYLALGDAF